MPSSEGRRESSTSTRSTSCRLSPSVSIRQFPEFGWRCDARGWVATNEATYFTSDSIALRATRTGHVVVRPQRIGKFTIVQPGAE